jgi:DNA helicase-2/ATP-dependent DNA helicase PcrA
MMLREQYQQKFDSILKELNQQQLKAVQAIDGPVLVIAGPGTGKTQILAARIANILVETDTLPENILCLTYTDAGTIAMRKRLLSFIGPDSYRVAIHTFHSFCNMVIQENLDVFGFRNLDPVDELEQVQLLRAIIDDLPKNHPLKRYTGEEYFESDRMKSLFDIMKREDWKPEYLNQKIEDYCNGLEYRDEYIYKKAGTRKDGTKFSKGDLNTDKLNEELRKMELLKAAANLFNDYNKRLQELKRYDFNDMILWVIKAFHENSGLLASYQERFLYFLVDEFQDTSGSQNELLQKLIQYWDKPNVFAVGDDDQSIYRFQGANVENIVQFQSQFKDHLELIPLENNYRSTQTILDISAQVIKNNKTRILEDKTLSAKGPNAKNSSYKPSIWTCHNSLHEASAITENILQLHLQGVPLKEIAVLYKNHAQSNEIIKYLQKKGLGINTRRRENILQFPVIRKIIQVMRYVDAESRKAHSGETYLFEILHYDEFKIPLLELASISTEIARKNFDNRSTSWRDELKYLATKKQQSLFEAEKDVTSLVKFTQTIESLIGEVHNVTVQELIQKIINQCGFLSAALGVSDQSWQMEMINTFFGFIKAECSKQTIHQLKSIVTLLNLMVEQEISLPAERVYYSEDGVNFITAHSSKGLEFDHVFLLGVNSQKWDSSKTRNQYKMPDNLFNHTEEEIEEARRLFYVALTRARKQLVISYHQHDLKGKELEPSLFVAEIREAGLADELEVFMHTEDLSNFIAGINEQKEIELPKSLLDSPYIDSLIEKYTLSVTHLNAYLHCPLSFYFNNFIKVPAAKSGALTFGSAVHYALELLFKKMNENPEKQFHDSSKFLSDFRWYMKKHQDSFVEAAYERRLEYGEQILVKFYEQYINYWNKVTSIEKSYRNVVMKGVPINGKLDKLEFDGNFVNVVDYKTGNYKKALKKFGRPNEEKVQADIAKGKEPSFEDLNGGDYWRQAVFYKLILDYDQTKQWEMRSAEFDFVEPDQIDGHFHKEKVAITPIDLEIVKKQVIDVYSKIKAKEFSKGCGKDDCDWCNFKKDWMKGKELLAAPNTVEEEE